jgi:hypothetical protein
MRTLRSAVRAIQLVVDNNERKTMNSHRALAKCTRLGVTSAALLAAVLSSPHTFATAQRTFVSTAGSDANACSLAAPCRSFQAAIAQTNANGEVIVLDSGGYGGNNTITSSVSIIAPPGVYAGVSVFNSDDGFDINGANIVVTLRGLTINGQGGSAGVLVMAADTVNIEDCEIANMGTVGVQKDGLSGATVIVRNSVIRNNGQDGLAFYGSIDPPAIVTGSHIVANAQNGIATGSPLQARGNTLARNGNAGLYVHSCGFTRTNLSDSMVSANLYGVELDSCGTGAVMETTISDSTIDGNQSGLLLTQASPGGGQTAVVTRTTISNNSDSGIYLYSANSNVLLDSATIAHNATYGVYAAGSTVIYTRNNNALRVNATDIGGSASITPVSGF